MTRLITVLAVALAAASVSADDGFAKEMPEARGSLWISIAVLAVAVLAMAVLAFKNPKRSHLD